MRRLLVLVVAAIVLVPGLAHADPLAGPQRVVEQGAADTAAACRRDLPASDAQCANVPMAPPVTRSRDRGLREGLGAPGAAAAVRARQRPAVSLTRPGWARTTRSTTRAVAPTAVSGLDSNQQLSMTDQLRMRHAQPRGRRALVPQRWPAGATPRSCATRAVRTRGTPAAPPRPLLTSALTEIAGWLRAHPRQVLLLYLEDHLETDDGYAQEPQACARPSAACSTPPAAPACTPLPLDRHARRRPRAPASRCSSSAAATTALAGTARSSAGRRARTRTVRPATARTASCDKARPPASFDSRLLRVFEDSTALSATSDQGSRPDHGQEGSGAAAVRRRHHRLRPAAAGRRSAGGVGLELGQGRARGERRLRRAAR